MSYQPQFWKHCCSLLPVVGTKVGQPPVKWTRALPVVSTRSRLPAEPPAAEQRLAVSTPMACLLTPTCRPRPSRYAPPLVRASPQRSLSH
jgi:hypothetical protein